MRRIEALAKRLEKLEAVHKPPAAAIVILATDEADKARQLEGLRVLPTDRGPMICLTGKPVPDSVLGAWMKAADGKTRGIPSQGN